MHPDSQEQETCGSRWYIGNLKGKKKKSTLLRNYDHGLPFFILQQMFN